MLFKINKNIFHDYPGVVIGVVVAHDINNNIPHQAVKQLLIQEQEKIRKTFTSVDLAEHPHVEPWYNAYKHFGANPKKYPPSISNLIARVLKGVPCASVNTIVDLYNIISLRYLLPAGGEDLDTIVGNIELSVATDHEKPIILLGDKEPHAPKPGEVIYKDDNGAICRRWNWKESDRTKLTTHTRHAIIMFEALKPVTYKIVEAAVNQAAAYIEEFCGGTATVAILDENNSEILLKKDNCYTSLHQRHTVEQSIMPLSVQTKTATVEPSFDEQYQVRVEKVKKLEERGVNPWPAPQPITSSCHTVIQEFSEEHGSPLYELAGRILMLRKHGKAIFATIQDASGRLQVYFKEDVIGQDLFAQLSHYIDIGDIIWCKGTSFKTKTGEITLKVDTFELLSKCLHPLPEKFHGIADVEITYRQRYLDLITNPESKERFKKRSLIISTMRSFFNEHGFLEVETPMLHPIPGGALAKPFVTHHNALNMDLYLRIAPELYLKRLIVGGFDRVYEINKCFRNEGISTKHNPEFTTVEYYIAYHDYHFMMFFTQKLLHHIAHAVCQTGSVQFGDHILDFDAPFKQMTMQEAVADRLQCKPSDLEGSRIDAMLAEHTITLEQKNASWGYKLSSLFEALVESTLIQPTFITQFPLEVSPLAKRNPENPDFADRFELFVAGMELANGFNELNNPFDQAARFHEQAKARAAGEQEAHYYDADFVHALEYGMPPTVGSGIGIDRLTMFLTNAHSIRDVILFPTMRQKE